MGKRAGIALGLLLGIGIAYEVVTTGPSSLGVTVTHHRRSAAVACVLPGTPVTSTGWTTDFDAAPRTPTFTATGTNSFQLAVIATSGSQFSSVFKSNCTSATPFATIVFKEHSGASGSTDLYARGSIHTCAYTGAYSRCQFQGSTTTDNIIEFGNLSVLNGNVSRPAATFDVLAVYCGATAPAAGSICGF